MIINKKIKNDIPNVQVNISQTNNNDNINKVDTQVIYVESNEEIIDKINDNTY